MAPWVLAHRPARGPRVDAVASARRLAALATDPDRVWPWWIERQLDPRSPAYVPPGDPPVVTNVTGRSYATIGVLGRPGRARVDPRGLVEPTGRGWSIDWWVHAGDRWYLPCRQPAVRQALIGHAPVIETTMRLPGGSIGCTAMATVEDVVALEVRNDTPAPVAVAFALRPCGVDGLGDVRSVEWDGDRAVSVDGRPALLLPRSPAVAAGRRWAEGDVLALLQPGEGHAWRQVRCADGLAQAAFVFPMARGTSLRAAVPVGSQAAKRQRPRLEVGGTDVEATVRGWDAHAAAGASVVVPVPRWAHAIDAARRWLLLAVDDGADPVLLATAMRWGIPTPAAPPGHEPAAPAAEPVAPPADGPAVYRRDGPGGFDPALTLTIAASEVGAGDERGLDRIRWALDSASPVWTWPSRIHPHVGTGCGGEGDDRRVTAAFLDAVRAVLVREDDDGLALCPIWPAEWGREGVEVHAMPTASGALSFAVRWHGERPALLWHLDGADVRLTAPGLDLSWSTTERAGDVLLSGGCQRPPATSAGAADAGVETERRDLPGTEIQ